MHLQNTIKTQCTSTKFSLGLQNLIFSSKKKFKNHIQKPHKNTKLQPTNKPKNHEMQLKKTLETTKSITKIIKSSVKTANQALINRNGEPPPRETLAEKQAHWRSSQEAKGRIF